MGAFKDAIWSVDVSTGWLCRKLETFVLHAPQHLALRWCNALWLSCWCPNPFPFVTKTADRKIFSTVEISRLDLLHKLHPITEILRAPTLNLCKSSLQDFTHLRLQNTGIKVVKEKILCVFLTTLKACSTVWTSCKGFKWLWSQSEKFSSIRAVMKLQNAITFCSFCVKSRLACGCFCFLIWKWRDNPLWFGILKEKVHVNNKCNTFFSFET